ncbi:GAF and ANTAR domain-containing protein [Kineococcus rhizosphaerae]|uniref:GAF domain-containing protein n=1 Tax=Kineococcus rhizosphaerae TaxID=559628 RepID=A0A2T0R3B5_9ACTN|nr:ANTAR domain-containing protein [Kineococcus rhizosphaerae]PRY14542.1 GAF domain-containing protein [Kineococcus rhizosphaerae]
MPLALEAAFLELGRLLLDQPLSAVLRRVADLAVECVDGVDDVSITLLRKGTPRTVVFHGDLAADLDERQYSLGYGPCVAAAQAGGTVRLDDTGHDDAFPDFSVAAARRGVRSVVAVGLPDPGRCQGAINAYHLAAAGAPPVSAQAQRALELFAQYAAVALGNAAALAEAGERAENLQIAMQSRAVIEQAKGVLVARHAISPDDAFARLASLSQHSNRKLRHVAQDLVAAAVAGTVPDTEPGAEPVGDGARR